MHKLFIPIIFILFITACNTAETPKNEPTQNVQQDSTAVVNDPKSFLNIQATSFTEIDTSGILLFPLSMGETTRDNDYTSYKSMPGNTHWNIAFYNTKTGEQHLLSDNKMLIKNYSLQYQGDATPKGNGKNIFYAITTEDFNGDKKFTEADATYLFMSDKAGNNLKQISPSNYNVQNWQYIATSNKIIMTLRKDSDKNKIFDTKDEVTNFVYDMNKGEAATEIFSTELKNKLKVLYDKDWKKIKN